MSLSHYFALRAHSPLVASSLLLAAAACNDADPLPTYVDVDYQVGCVFPECRALSSGPERVIMKVDGETGFDNSCTATRVNGVDLVTLRIRSVEEEILFEIANALYDVENNVGDSCRVKITEGDNTYEGRCSSAAPTPSIPCQLTNFSTNNGGSVEGSLYCDNIPAASSPSTTRDVARSGAFSSCTDSSGASVDPRNCPATFLIEPCSGL